MGPAGIPARSISSNLRFIGSVVKTGGGGGGGVGVGAGAADVGVTVETRCCFLLWWRLPADFCRRSSRCLLPKMDSKSV